MEKKLLAVIVLILIASLSVAGCTVGLPGTSSPTPTPTPISSPTVSTPTPQADYGSFFDKFFESGNAITERPFTKSANARGNDVYKGIVRNSSLPESYKMTTVIELMSSKTEAKSLYDQTVAQKIGEGFTPRPDFAASYKAQFTYVTEVWAGIRTGQQFYVMYYNEPMVSPSWLVTTEA